MFRRTLIGAACGCTLALPLCAEAVSDPRTAPRVFGCCIPKSIAPSYISRATGSPKFEASDVDVKSLVKNSPDRDFDFALAQTLAMLCEKFNVLPNFSYYQEFGEDENALATEQTFGSHPDGTVLLGLRMAGAMLTRTENGPASAVAVVAHEFGHIVANKLDLSRQLAPDKTKPFRAEQFADFMSGAFGAMRQKDYDQFPAAAFSLTMWDIGGVVRGTHGTREERGKAVATGFQAAKNNSDLSDVVTAGFQYSMSVN